MMWLGVILIVISCIFFKTGKKDKRFKTGIKDNFNPLAKGNNSWQALMGFIGIVLVIIAWAVDEMCSEAVNGLIC